MAEFCIECWNKINKTKISAKECVLSKNLYLCEGCGELKVVIIALTEKKHSFLYNLLNFYLG